VGACIGVVFGLLEAGGRTGVVKGMALWVPVGTLMCTAIFGGKYLAAWAFGWAVQRWAQGILAAAVGAVIGGSLGALIGYRAGGRSQAKDKASSDG
jgi:hypothetical protein